MMTLSGGLRVVCQEPGCAVALRAERERYTNAYIAHTIHFNCNFNSKCYVVQGYREVKAELGHYWGHIPKFIRVRHFEKCWIVMAINPMKNSIIYFGWCLVHKIETPELILKGCICLLPLQLRQDSLGKCAWHTCARMRESLFQIIVSIFQSADLHKHPPGYKSTHTTHFDSSSGRISKSDFAESS